MPGSFALFAQQNNTRAPIIITPPLDVSIDAFATLYGATMANASFFPGDDVITTMQLTANGVVQTLAMAQSAFLTATPAFRGGTQVVTALTINTTTNTLALTLSEAQSATWTPGVYNCSVTVTFIGPQVQTWPTSGTYLTLTVKAR